MARLKIVWTDDAKEEFKNTMDFYINRNQSLKYALKVRGLLRAVQARLKNNPEMGRLMEDLATRVVRVDKFDLLYQRYDDTISIVSFWDPKQDPDKRFDRR